MSSESLKSTPKLEMEDIATLPGRQSVGRASNPPKQSIVDDSATLDLETDARREEEFLPRIADKVPIQVWIIILISTLERFAFFGLREPFQNYLQNPANDPLRPGALGLGQSTATNISYLFSFLLYIMPLFASVVIDSYLGRYKGLLVALSIYLLGAFTLLITSLPPCLEAGAGLPGFIIGIVLMSIGIGGVKAGMSPLMADQYTTYEDKIVTRSNGKRFIITRDLTIGKIYHIYYWGVNIGALGALATTYMEKDIGFWAAYLLPFCGLCCAALTLLVCRNKISERPPSSNVLPMAFRVLVCAAKNGFSMEEAKLHNQGDSVDWDNDFVTDLQRGILACRIFAMYPFLWVCHLQINNNLVSQAAQMETGGLPNDVFPTLNPIAVLVLLPMVQNGLYPWLRKVGISFPPINRMAIGFLIEAAAIAYCAGIQRLIYTRGPCYDYALDCTASNGGRVPNRANVWLQAPVYILDGLAEVFFDVVSQEYAYNKAPDNMKSVVQAVLSAMSGIGAVLGLALYPVAHNPYLVYMFSALAAINLIVAILFWIVFRKYNEGDSDLNKRDTDKSKAVPRSAPQANNQCQGHIPSEKNDASVCPDTR